MQQLAFFRAQQLALRRFGCFEQRLAEFGLIWHQYVERHFARRRRIEGTPHAMAAIAGDGVKPGRKGRRILKLGQMFERAEEHLLRSILGVFAVAAHLHAEGIDRILQ